LLTPWAGRFAGTEEELRTLISQGGHDLSMPAWKGTLSESDLDRLASYVTDPGSEPAGDALFGQHCAACHGEKVPTAPDKESAAKIISSGGAHVTMPIWGNILTSEQLDALTQYTFDTSRGTGSAVGAQLFDNYCSSCHGQFGEGGPNPARAGDTIAPISSAEYLKTRDDVTLRNIISRGQPDFGMSPFGETYGGPLDDEQVDSIVAFIRRWEANPPVELPPEIISATPSAPDEPSLSGSQIFVSVCASCHGENGEGGVGPALNTQEFQDKYNDQVMFDTIRNGHEATSMIAWGEILTSEQIMQLVQFIRRLNPSEPANGSVSYSDQVVPLFQAKCQACHNQGTTLGGWDSTSYEAVMNTGNNGPVVIPGDTTNSILAQRVTGTRCQ
jgi:mono/diheme cytochrome c family protein